MAGQLNKGGFNPDRRRLLKAGALAGAGAGLVGAPIAAQAAGTRVLAIHDSSIPEAKDFGAGQTRFDVADLHAHNWAPLRALDGAGLRVDGLTRWSDAVSARAALETQGFRLVAERRVEAPLSGADHLYRWTLARG
jgi:hypothetical protein